MVAAAPTSVERCAEVTFATGNSQWDDSSRVEVYTNGSWSPIPSSCTNKSSTCQYDFCADSFKIKVGDDGWRVTVSVNGHVVNDPSKTIKNEELAYTLPGGAHLLACGLSK